MLDQYDICIIGAGLSGALLGEASARSGAKVVLLEAGKKWPLKDRMSQLTRNQVLGEPQWPWVEPDRDLYEDTSRVSLGRRYPLNSARVQGVGGSSLHWGGLAQRMRESDFKTYSTYGMAIDWPISYADLEPYYVRAEHEIGVSGRQNPDDPYRSAPLPMDRFPPGYDEKLWEPVLEKMGVSYGYTTQARNSASYRGRSPCIAYSVCNICPSGARYSSDFHVDLAEKTGRCDLLTQTVARRIETDSSGTVTSVQANSPTGDVEVRAKTYVVAAHAIESARLLLLSGIDRYADHIGHYLMEHWYGGVGGYQRDQLFPRRIGFHGLESNFFYDGAERAERGAFKLEFDVPSPHRVGSELKSGIWGKELRTRDCERFGHWLGLTTEVEHQPHEKSFVGLSDKLTDKYGDPAPHINFYLDQVDRTTFDQSIVAAQKLLEARGVKDTEVTHQYVEAAHHMGTLRMANSNDEGVVDRNCKVFGTSNLYCAGSSTFTTGGARQPSLTIAALALRLADHLAGKSTG